MSEPPPSPPQPSPPSPPSPPSLPSPPTPPSPPQPSPPQPSPPQPSPPPPPEAVIQIVSDDDVERRAIVSEYEASVARQDKVILWMERILKGLWWSTVGFCSFLLVLRCISQFADKEMGTHLNPDYTDHGEDLKFVFCSGAHTRFDVETFNKNKKMNLSLSFESDAESDHSLERLIAVATDSDLEHYTITARQTLDKFMARQMSAPWMGLETFEGVDMFEKYGLGVYNEIVGTDICTHYYFPQSKETIWYGAVAFDTKLKDRSILRSLILSMEVSLKVNKFRAFYTHVNSSTYRDYIRAPEYHRGLDYKMRTSQYSEYTFRVKMTEEKGTEAIFFQTCSHSRYDRHTLIGWCIQDQTISNLNRQSPMAVIRRGQTSGLLILSEADMKNDVNIRKKFRKYVDDCHHKYEEHQLCREFFVDTQLVDVRKGTCPNLTFKDHLPSEPSWVLTHNPVMDMEVFFLGILTILCTAFGVSFIGIKLFRWNRYRSHGRLWGFGWNNRRLSPQSQRDATVATISHELLIAKSKVAEMEARIIQLEAASRNPPNVQNPLEGNNPDAADAAEPAPMNDGDGANSLSPSVDSFERNEVVAEVVSDLIDSVAGQEEAEEI